MLIEYTGNGKGKTTAAIGIAIRSLSYGKRVLFAQFMKKQASGERKILKNEGADVIFDGTTDFLNRNNIEENKNIAKNLMKKIIDMDKAMRYDVIILDELNIAVTTVLELEDVVEFVKKLGYKERDIVITGRNAPKSLINMADLVTEMKEIKHPFSKGIPAKEGIDF